MFSQVIRDFLMLFVTIDPIGTVALFVALTTGAPPDERNRIVQKAVVVAGAVLLAFLVAGQILLSLAAEQVIGGIESLR